jgi:hypothetical protein
MKQQTAECARTKNEAYVNLSPHTAEFARTKHDVKANSTSTPGALSRVVPVTKVAPYQTPFQGTLSRANNEATVVPDGADQIEPLENKEMLALLYSLNTPRTSSIYHFDTDTESICIDTGASACLSPKKNNFVSLKEINNLKINGIASGLQVGGIGTLKWSIRDDNNNEIDLYIKDALYVPSAPMGLLCPQQIAQQTQNPGDGFLASGTHGVLTFAGYKRTIKYDSRSRLPILHTIEGASAYIASLPNTTAETANLSTNQKLLLKWHNRLAHTSFSHIQELARQGRLPKAIASCNHPVCSSCQYGKAHRRPSASVTKAQPIDSGDLQPGDCVSVDQIESSAPGLVDNYSGKPTTARYHAASLYTDHASRFMFLKCHYSTGGNEAVEGKQRFEHFAGTHGVKIKAYRADNGIMAKREYIQNVELHQQSITLSGVNHHSQNGIAERNIRTITDRARTMLLHAIEKWPAVITMDLWPFALKMAVDIHNATPGKSGLSPEEIFIKQKSRPDRLVDFHTFGCPVFVLDPTLQQGHKLPKWQPRSRQAIYLGHSPRHAQTVPIVLNIKTGLCSPQYHVVFDDHFTTTAAATTNIMPSNWPELFHNRIDCFEGESASTQRPALAQEWMDTDTPHTTTSEGDTDMTALPVRQHPEGDTIRDTEAPAGDSSRDSTLRDTAVSEGDSQTVSTQHSQATPVSDQAVTHSGQHVPQPWRQQQPRLGWNAEHSHNTRFRTRIQEHLARDSPATASGLSQNTEQITVSDVPFSDKFTAMVAATEALYTLEDGTSNFTYPSAFLSTNEKDTLHYGEMLQ